jgi:hypothetical protein
MKGGGYGDARSAREKKKRSTEGKSTENTRKPF